MARLAIGWSLTWEGQVDPRQRLADPSLAAQRGPVAKESGDTKVEEIAGLHRKTLRSISRCFSAFSSLADLSPSTLVQQTNRNQ